MTATVSRLYPPASLFLVFCTCHHQTIGVSSSTVRGLTREGWFRIR